MIEVILMERIERLGNLGQVVKVRPGFARNCLLPQKKALRATKANMEIFEKQRAELEAKNAALRAASEKEAAKMEGVKLVVIRQASETGMLFGSVSARDVADIAKADGHAIDRTQVQIDTPIKALGLFPVKIKLHPEVIIKVTVNVARSVEEAAVQAEKGAAIVKAEAAAAAKAEAAAEVAVEAKAENAEAPAEESKPKKKKAKAEATEAKADAEEAPKKAKKPRAKKADAE